LGYRATIGGNPTGETCREQQTEHEFRLIGRENAEDPIDQEEMYRKEC
jgi:hypothetical protein